MTQQEKSRMIRDKLSENHLTQAWLIAQLTKAGVLIDKSRFSSALHGTVRGESVNRILDESIRILEQYETFYS